MLDKQHTVWSRGSTNCDDLQWSNWTAMLQSLRHRSYSKQILGSSPQNWYRHQTRFYSCNCSHYSGHCIRALHGLTWATSVPEGCNYKHSPSTFSATDTHRTIPQKVEG